MRIYKDKDKMREELEKRQADRRSREFIEDSKTNKTVIDLVGITYNKWEKGDNVIFDIAPGRGKTYFVKDKLYRHVVSKNYGKKKEDKLKLLYLCNRTALLQEVQIDKGYRKGYVHASTYQKLQEEIMSGEVEPITHYEYIVCDECHYIYNEAWNDKTDQIVEWLNSSRNNVKIFMSATHQGTERLFRSKRRWLYQIDANYEHIKKIVFYEDDDFVEDLLKIIPENEKLIYFSRNIEHARHIFNLYDNSSFVCSKYTSDKKNVRMITKDALEKGRLKYKVTCCTSVWDTGINIHDDQLKHIVCSFENTTNLIQAIHRKRLATIKEEIGEEFEKYDKKCEEIVLYIKNWRKSVLQKNLRKKEFVFDDAWGYICDEEVYRKQKNQERSKVLNPCLYIDWDSQKVKVNDVRLWALQEEIGVFREMIAIGFDQYLLKKLGDTFQGELVYEKARKHKVYRDEFLDYLKNNRGNKYFKAERVGLKKAFEKSGLKLAESRCMGMKTMNAYMKDNAIPYELKNIKMWERNAPKEQYGKTYWVIESIDKTVPTKE